MGEYTCWVAGQRLTFAPQPSGRTPLTARARMAALPMLALMLGGCLSAPPIHLDPPLPDHWRNVSADASARPAPKGAWWKAFNDARLDAIVETALRENLEVGAAIERLRAARLLDRHASDPYLPNLHARTDDAIDPDASASFFVAGFDSMWEFGLFGKRDSAKRVARAQLDAATVGVAGARVSLIAEVVRNWIELRSAQHKEAILSRIRDAEVERLRLLHIRQINALSSSAEISEVETELAGADAAMTEPRQTVNAAMQRLATLVGSNAPDPTWLGAGEQPSLGAIRLESVPAELLRSRPEIAKAEANALRAAGELGLSRAQMYPFIGVRAGIQWSTKITSNRPSPSQAVLAIGPVIDIPLFDWGDRIANAHAQAFELKAALLEYRQNVLVGVAEVESALGDLEQLERRVEAMTRAVQSAARTAALTEKRAEFGVDSPLDGEDQRIASDRRALDLLDSRAQHSLAFVALNKALGGADALAGEEPR